MKHVKGAVTSGGVTAQRNVRKGETMLGAIVAGLGVYLMITGFGSGSSGVGMIGVVLLVAGLALFWRTSATRAYLNNQKNRR